MRTAALAVAVCLIALPILAQPTCPTPVIVQTGGPNPTCTGVPVTLDAGANWVSYQWSNGATQRFLIDSPTVTTSYWVTTTDVNGCSATSQPFQVSVVPAPPPPAISVSSAALCAGAPGTATDTSGVTWTSHAWSITHGAITADRGTSADFTVDGSGPAAINLVVTDASGCTVTGTTTVNVRTIAAPLIRPSAAQICAGSYGSVYLDPPADRNSSWQNVQWTVTNATVNNQSSYSVSFTTDPSGQPVTVRVDATDNLGCSATTSVTISVRTIAPPRLNAGQAAICAGSYGSVYIDPPDDHTTTWQNVQWTVSNGTISYQSNYGVNFTTDPAAHPVTVTAVATDSLGCSATNSVTIPVRTIPPPVLHPGQTAICPGSYGSVWIDPPDDHSTTWQTVQWTVSNGTISYQSNYGVTFNTDPASHPVTVTAVATDSLGCSNQSSVTIPVRSIAPPVLHPGQEAVCPGSYGSVWVDPPDDHNTTWQTMQWTVSNATITYQSSYGVNFTSDPAGQPVTVTAVATDSLGCSNSASVTIPVRTIAPPTIHAGQSALCPGSPGSVYIDPPPGQYSSWSTVSWSVSSGTITNQSVYGVNFTTDPGGQPLTVTATATDNLGCTATSSVTIPVRVLTPPAIHPYNAVVCAGAATGATVDPPNDPNGWTNIRWSIVNGTITSQSGRSVQFDTNPQGGFVTLTVAVVDTFGCQASSIVTIPTQTVIPPTLYLDYDASCPGAQNRVRMAPPANPSSSWSNTQWSITNGTANGMPGLDTFSFYTDASGQPATITVTAFDSLGCSASASITVPTHAIAPPTIQLTNPSSCPGAANHATLGYPADPGTYWTSQTWSITNGTLTSSPFYTNVDFTTDPSGQPAVLSVTATDSQGCTATSSVTIGVRTITPPRITFDAAASCAGASHGATVSYPNEPNHYWQYVQWSITHGTITNGQTWTNVQFTTDLGGQPATLSVTVTDDAGCTTSASATLPVRTITPPRIVFDAPATCPGSPNGAQVAYPDDSGTYWTSVRWTITNGTITNGETWTNVQFTTDPGGQPATLTVYATDSLGCTTSASASVGVRSITPPRIVLDAPAVCAGAASAAQVTYPNEPGHYWSSAHWTIANGTITNGETWTNVQFTTDPAGQPATLSVVLSDNLGCTTSATATVGVRTIEPPPVYLDFDAVCAGGSDHARVPSPLEPGTYWVSGQWTITNGTITNATSTDADFTTDPGGQPASVYVTLLDNFGCRTVASATVGVSAGAPAIQLSASAPSACAGGSVTVSSTDPRTLHGWSWSVVNGTITGPADGSSVTVTANGAGPLRVSASALTEFGSCGATGTAVIPVLMPSISASGPTAFCAGGSVTLTASAGSSYAWSNGATTQSIAVTSSGSYSVTVSTAGGCSATSAPVAVNVLPAPSAIITPSGPTTFCAGGSVTLTAPSGYSYSWSTGATTQSITVSTAGTFSVTVTDSNGCSAASSVTTAVNAASASINVDVPLSCSGTPAQLSLAAPSGGTWQSIQWTATNATIVDGATGAVMHLQANGGSTATVTVNATDSFGCSATATTTLTPAVPITITSSAAKLCSGGGARLTAHLPDGDSFASATWTLTNATSYWGLNGAIIDIAPTGAGPITATVTGTDSFGCSGSATITIPYETGADTTITAPASGSFCQGSEFTVSVPDAGPGATYAWGIGGGDFRSSGMERTATFYATSTDIFITISITANGCTANGRTSLTAMPTANVTVTAPAPVCYLSTNQTASVSDAGPGATYEWVVDNPDFQIRTTADPRVVSFDSIPNPNFSGYGTIGVWVTNGNGCRQYYTTSMRIVVPAATIGYTGPTTFCPGGHLTLTAGPTGAGYSYLWSNGATTPTIDVTQSGSYTVTVSWYGTCPKTSDAVVVSVTPPAATISASTTHLCGSGATATLTANSGASYLWSTGATTQAITVGAAGSYSVTVTNAAGCSATSAAVTVDAFNVTVTPPSLSICQANSGYTLTASPAVSYLWSNGATTQTIGINSGGSYTVTATGANGCSVTSAPVVVTVRPSPSVTIAADRTTICQFGQSVHITGSVTGGSGTYTHYRLYDTYNFQLVGDSSTALDFTLTPNRSTTTYAALVDDANGCGSFWSNNLTITLATPPAHGFSVSYGPYPGNGNCSTSPVTISVGYPSEYASFLWSNGATTSSITVNTTGTYTVTATTSAGCTYSDSVSLTFFPPPPKPVITASSTSICAGQSVTLTSTPAASYFWDNGATTQSITVTPSPGTGTFSYGLRVTDAHGCYADADRVSITVSQAPAYVAFATLDNACGTTSATVDANEQSSSRPTAGDTYLWSNGVTTKSFVTTVPGTFHVTVTSAQGCTMVSNNVNVVFNAPMSVTASAQTPTTICSGGSVTIGSQVTGGVGPYTYRWSSNDPALPTYFGATASVTVTPTASHYYYVQVWDQNNCTVTSAHVDVVVDTPPSPVITVTGSLTFCPGGSVTLTAPAGYTYAWSNGATTQSIAATQPGVYYVTVTNATGCTARSGNTSVSTYTPPPTPSITAGGPTTFCAGGSVTLTAPSGYTYSWSTGETTRSIAVSSTGSYTVTVADAHGCTATSAATNVTANPLPPTPVITASGPTSFCPGGSVVLTAPAGYTYLWSTGATTQSMTAVASGSTTVTVTDANGCRATSAPVTTTVYSAPPSPAVSITPSSMICEGQTATLTGPAGYSYQWSTGATTQSISTTASGTFVLTVTDANGCTASSTSYVTVYPVPATPTLTASGPTTFCQGGSVTLTAPTGYTNYLWSNGSYSWTNGSGQPQNQITVFNSGTYTVSVRGDNFCYSTSAPVVVTVNPTPAKPVITASGPTVFCQGGSVTLSAPAGYSYSWSNGATTQSIVATAQGSYTVTVTDANGCSSPTSDSTFVTVYPLPETPAVTPSGPTTFCQGGSVQLSGPSGPNVWYHWSSGETWQTITVTNSGTYRLTVQNQYGCTSTSADVVVTVNSVPAKPTVTASGPTTFCTPGSVTLTASDLAPGDTYQWLNGGVPNGQTTKSITVTQGGYYAVRAVSPNGCGTPSDLVTVTVYQTPSGSISANGPTTFCTPGSVTLTAPSGGSGEMYYWYPSGANTQSITVSSSGSYSVRITSAYGCQFTTDAVAVNAVTPPSPTITPSGSTALCAGQSVTLTAPSGYTYLWSPGNQTTRSISVSSAGSYHVTVTDANGCSGTSADTAVTVHPTAVPVINPGPTVAICAGAYRTFGFTHMSPDYASWTWSTGETTREINISAAGSYTVTAVDSYGCAWTSDPVVVTINPSPTASVSANHTAICAGGSVTLTGSVAGGTAPFSYLWLRGNGTTVAGATSTTLSVTQPDNYAFFVTDANGCTSQSSFVNVTNSTLTAPTVSVTGSTTFCSGGSVTLTAPAGYSYSWTGTTATTQAIVVTATGSYAVTVTDGNGCSATSTLVSVTVNPLPSATITPSGSTTFCSGGSVTLAAPSGTGYSYSWSPGNATTQSINVTASGTYTVTVTNTATGCSASSSSTVTVNANPATPTITAGGSTTFCNGGSVTLTAPAGYTYSWSTGATTQSIVATSQGSYTVTVTNANNCSATSAATVVTVNPTITAFGPLTQTVARNATPQNITVTATGPTLKYQWYKGTSGNTTTKANSTTNSFKPPTGSSGTFTYWVRVTSGTCTADSATATVTVN